MGDVPDCTVSTYLFYFTGQALSFTFVRFFILLVQPYHMSHPCEARKLLSKEVASSDARDGTGSQKGRHFLSSEMCMSLYSLGMMNEANTRCCPSTTSLSSSMLCKLRASVCERPLISVHLEEAVYFVFTPLCTYLSGQEESLCFL